MNEIDIDIAVVGAGLCGLALARALHARGRRFLLFEARERLGGRILGEHSASGMALDLGPTWFWPEAEPHMAALIAELGLDAFPQNDSGTVLRMRDPNKTAEGSNQGVHGGAQRLSGGMSELVQALAGFLPTDQVRLAHELVAVTDVGAHLELRFRSAGESGAAESVIRARRVVLAVPPRLLFEHVRFTPALDPERVEAMRTTPTWMATQAKALMTYTEAFWREDGHSGNAFVRHEQAVLGEIFDACGGPDASLFGAALGGFCAMSPQQRTDFKMGMPMLVQSQLSQLFGERAEQGDLHFHDWADEPYTCAALDLAEPEPEPADAPEYGHPALARSGYGGRLYFGASETAQHGGGHMEGALDAAVRLQQALSPARAAQAHPISALNAHCIERFATWAGGQRESVFAAYQRTLHARLSSQAHEQLTRNSVLDSIVEAYEEALRQLAELPFDASGSVLEPGWSELTPPVLQPMHDVGPSLLDEVLRFNHSSCAISNFPDEHAPGSAYLADIQRDMYAAWRKFVLAGNDILMQKAA